MRRQGLAVGSKKSIPWYDSFFMAKMVKISVSVDKDKLRLAKTQAKEEGVSLSALITRGLGHELEARARLQAALELYGSEGWPSEDERRAVLESWTRRRPAKKERSKRGTA
jgi:hypothetical protein